MVLQLANGAPPSASWIERVNVTITDTEAHVHIRIAFLIAVAALTSSALLVTTAGASECAHFLKNGGQSRVLDTSNDTDSPEYHYLMCINEVATYECRDSSSPEAYSRCFIKESMSRFKSDNVTYELCKECDRQRCGFQRGLNAKTHKFDVRTGGFECGWPASETGGSDEWCVRKSIDVVSWCTGSPQNFRCKDESCSLGSCLTACPAVKPRFKE
jgi:hypothetical protein